MSYQQDWVLRMRYGITSEDYATMLKFQNGKCAICGGRQDGGKKNMDVDHSHEDESVRGLLCGLCNKRLAILENQEFVVAALRYIDDPPAPACGVFRRTQKLKPSGWFGKRTDEYRAMLRERTVGIKRSPEAIINMQIAARKRGGHPHTPESKAKIAIANSRRVWTAESRAKASHSKLGNKYALGGDAL